MGLSRGKARALRLAASALFVLIALPYACIPIHRFPPPVPFSGAELFNPYARLSGTWQRANLHAHGRAWSGLTSGRQSNEEVVRRYRELGYDVPGVSNYHEIAAHDGVATIPLYEHGYNLGKHHQLAIGARRVEWLDLPVWQSRSHLQFLIDRVAATADLVALVHPVSRDAYSAADLSALTGYHLIEIVNGKFPHDEVWDAALSAGRAVWGVANDDNHDLADPERLAVAWTMIDAPSPATADIVDALRDGRSYAVLRTAEGSMDADVRLSSVTVHDSTLDISLSGVPAAISFVGQNGEVRKTVESATSAAYAIQPHDTYVRAVVRAPRSTLYLNPVVRHDGVALPAPVASIDQTLTWLLRAAALAALIAIVVAYRRRRRPARLTAVALTASVLACPATPAVAQDLPLGAGYWADFFVDLPASDNLFAVLETVQPSLISDRFSNGGLHAGEPARIGGFLSSWTQTAYRLGDLDITDPTGNGMPLLFPELPLWTGFAVETGLHGSAGGAHGLSVQLEPWRPGDAWSGAAYGSLSHFPSARRSGAPPAADLRHRDRLGASISGPLVRNRLGLVASGSWTRATQRERAEAGGLPRALGSAFAHLVFTPGGDRELRTIVWVQRASRPFVHRLPFGQPDASTNDRAAHVQFTWTERGRPWRLYGGYTRRRTVNDYDASTEVEFERLRDGPVSELAWLARGTAGRWALGAYFGPPPMGAGAVRNTPRARVEVEGLRTSSNFPGAIVRERVDGTPARLWSFANPTGDSVRSAVNFAVDASDRIDFVDRVIVDAGLRFDLVSGSARDAADAIDWRSWMPRAGVRWTLTEAWRTAVFGGYRRSVYRLPLDFLAVGDPGAPTANVFRWTGAGSAATTSTLPVMRAGPGTGGIAAFSRIDSSLDRPTGDEIAVGFQVQPRQGLMFAWTGLARRERHLIGLVDIGAPASAYSQSIIADPGADVLNPEDDRLVAVYDRRPATFALDRYLLTNPDAAEATFKGFEITFRHLTDRVHVFGGATAGIARGSAASRGFGPLENDQSRLGELYINPNAATFAEGRLFNDRAYTVKLAAVIKFRDDVRLGVIARYQDGQPFSRFLVVPSLNQGVEAIRAFPNGDSRFTYTATLDTRLQKIFTAGERRVAVILDAYNLVNLANEVEEVTTSPPGVRIASAVQPPLAIHVGARVTF